MHATAYCPRHIDPLPSGCVPCSSYNLCCADTGPCQGVHAQVHSYTPTGKGRVLREAFLSTGIMGTGTGSGGGSGKQSKVDYQAIGVVLAVASATAYAVSHLDQREMARIQDKAATEVAQAKAEVARIEGERKSEVARVEGERKLSEERLKAEVERYKQDVLLTYTEDYKPYQRAISKKKKKRGGTGGPQKEEEKD